MGTTPFDPRSITKPDPSLLTYYAIVSLAANVAWPVAMFALYWRYVTLKYALDDEGISMSWGILDKREVVLTYRRIQDIHVTRNLVHRWLGLSTVAIQTAAGSSSAELTLEGIRDPEGLRDFLYLKMRGVREEPHHTEADDALVLLGEIRDELRALREERRS